MSAFIVRCAWREESSSGASQYLVKSGRHGGLLEALIITQ